jgi:hypothetical protein
MIVKRGRKSAASQAVPSLVDLDQFKPSAPDHLTPEQQQTWTEIVQSMRPGSFPPSVHHLLELYTVHVARCRFIEEQMRSIDIKTEFKKFKMWASMQCAETSMLCMLCTKLRMTVKTNTRKQLHETDASGQPWLIRKKRPWEDDSDDEPEPEPAA